MCASRRYLENIISSELPNFGQRRSPQPLRLCFCFFFSLCLFFSAWLFLTAPAWNFGWFGEKRDGIEQREQRCAMLKPDASRTSLYLNRLYFSCFTSTIAFFFRYTSPSLVSRSQQRDVLQVGLCIRRNCYIASNTCTSSRQSLTYRMSHSRVRECCAKKKMNALFGGCRIRNGTIGHSEEE